MRPAVFALATLTATSALAAGGLPAKTPAHAPVVRTARAPLSAAALRFGRSLGSPNDGRLVGGMHLEDAAYVRVVPADQPGDVRWGLQPLVTMLDRSARAVRRQFPGAITSVGHLSREGGGELEQHRSHESGRDADVGFFVRSTTGAQLLESRFVRFKADGSAVGWPGAFFDDTKNWALVSSLLTDPQAHVTHIFVSTPLRARLLAYADRVGVPASLRMRAAEILQQPHGTLPHDDHFHVRISCPAHMAGCVENPIARARPASPARAGHPYESHGAYGSTGVYGRRGPAVLSGPEAPAAASGASMTRAPTSAMPEPAERSPSNASAEPPLPAASMNVRQGPDGDDDASEIEDE